MLEQQNYPKGDWKLISEIFDVAKYVALSVGFFVLGYMYHQRSQNKQTVNKK